MYSHKKGGKVWPLQTRLLLLATSYGREFAQQIAQVGSCVYLLSGGEGEQSHVTAPLIEVADQAVLTYWMRSIKKVPRLLPLQDKVFILCNPSNYPEFVAWAGNGNRSSGGFPISNIIACPNASEDGMLKHLAWFIEQSYDSHLVVAEADYCFEPDFNLQRIVEHSLLRGTDTVATMPIPRTVKGADLSQFAYATVENPAAACPCVLEVFMDPPAEDAGADGGACVRAIAPLYVFRRSTCRDIVSFAHTADCSGSKQVARFLIAQQQQQQQRPLHTLGVDFAFNVRTLQDFLFTDAFFQYFNKEKARFLASGKKRNNDSDIQLWEEPPDQPAVALEARHKHQLSVAAGEASDPSGAFAAYSQQAEEKQRAVFGDTTLHALLDTFTKTFHLDVSVGRACDAPSVPDRFADVGSWRLKPQLQHPCYITSNNSYGRQQPQQAEMPLVWHGMQGQFTSSFNGHTYHNCSLVTGVKRSKVHKLLDEFAPHT